MAAYLVQNSSGYCFRLIVPPDLRTQVGRVEIRRSLRGADHRTAGQLSSLIAGKIHQVFRKIRSNTSMGLSPHQIQQLINGFIHECLDYEEQNRLEYQPVYDGLDDMPDLPDEYLTQVDDFTDDAREQLKRGDYSKVGKVVDHILDVNNLNVDPASMDYKTLCREILKAQVEILRIEKNRNEGDYSDVLPPRPEPPAEPSVATPSPAPEPTPSPILEIVHTGPSFGDLAKKYIDFNINANLWKRRSISTYEGHFRVLEQVIGADTPVSTFDHPNVSDIRDTLLMLPAGMNKKKIFQDKSVDEILNINETEQFPTMSISTVNNYLVTLGTFFKWCVNRGEMDANYADGKKIKTRAVDPSTLREIFNPDDLKRLFHSPAYLEDTHGDGYEFWLPVLALYTGARLNELCQVRLDDIQDIDGIYAFVLNEDEEGVTALKDKKVSIKSTAGLRQIPIHPFVADTLNLRGYVNYMKAKGETRLFPELPFQNGNYGHKASKWFGTYRKAQGVDSPKKVYHCFRHTLTDNLKQQLIPESLPDELTGHAGNKGISYGRYGKAYTLEVLYNEAVLKLNYNVDLEHLKRSRWTKY